jgi:hypothetical protein
MIADKGCCLEVCAFSPSALASSSCRRAKMLTSPSGGFQMLLNICGDTTLLERAEEAETPVKTLGDESLLGHRGCTRRMCSSYLPKKNVGASAPGREPKRIPDTSSNALHSSRRQAPQFNQAVSFGALRSRSRYSQESSSFAFSLGGVFLGGLPSGLGTKSSTSDRRTNFLPATSTLWSRPSWTSWRIRS